MKDLYSFSRSDQEHQKFYDSITQAYLRIFKTIGLGDDTYLTYASGGAFTQFSHEFQTVTDNGEDTIYLDRQKGIAINEEVYNDEVIAQTGVNRDNLEKVKAAEVGNIFSFGTHKSEQLGLFFTDEAGGQKPVVLGSYGIGVTRLMGVLTEHFADDRGLVWPDNIAPYSVYLASLGDADAVKHAADEAYDYLTEKGVTVLYDDRDERPGEKFADADLFGIPHRLVVSDKSLAAGGIEYKQRRSTEVSVISLDQIPNHIKKPRQD
jgi:prolyl-tRNA synthetase